MDLYCSHCGEPWSHEHIIDEFKIRDLDDVETEMAGDMLDPEGQWWRFRFLYPDQFYEANYMIERCSACEPGVGRGAGETYSLAGECRLCFGHGRIFMRRLRLLANAPDQGWWVGYSNRIEIRQAPFRNGHSYQCVDGWVEQGWGWCPECFKTAEEYWAAMTAAGWTEPKRPKGKGILRRMIDKEENKNELHAM